MHHKRGKPKDARSGCLLCKGHKSNGTKDTKGAKTAFELRADEDMEDQLKEALEDERTDDQAPEEPA